MAQSTDRYARNDGNSLARQTRDLLEYLAGMRKSEGTLVFTGNPADGDDFVLDDGVGDPISFEFDDDSSVSSGAVAITIGAAAANTASNTITAINGVTTSQALDTDPLQMVATASGTDSVLLTHGFPGTVGNVSITESAANFTVTGMSGGVDGGQVDTELVSVTISGAILNIGAVNLLNTASAVIDPSTEGKQDTVIASLSSIDADTTTLIATASAIQNNVSGIEGYVDAIETNQGTQIATASAIQNNTSNMEVSLATLSGTVAGNEMQVDIVGITKTEVNPTNLVKAVAASGVALAFGTTMGMTYFAVEARKADGPNVGKINIGTAAVTMSAAQEIPLDPGEKYEFTAPMGYRTDRDAWFVVGDYAGDGITGYYLPS